MSAKIGGNTGSIEQSPNRRKRRAAGRRREEARWARRAGPVVVTHLSTNQVSDSLDEEGEASAKQPPSTSQGEP